MSLLISYWMIGALISWRLRGSVRYREIGDPVRADKSGGVRSASIGTVAAGFRDVLRQCIRVLFFGASIAVTPSLELVLSFPFVALAMAVLSAQF